jgi:rSAM-partnered protein
MVEKARRTRVEESRPDADPAWEVFARDEADDPLRYVGTVRADDADAAHERATKSFCWYAEAVWVCPTAEVRKFSVDATAEREKTPDEGDGPEKRREEGGRCGRCSPGLR